MQKGREKVQPLWFYSVVEMGTLQDLHHLKNCSQNLIVHNWTIFPNLLDLGGVQETEAGSHSIGSTVGSIPGHKSHSCTVPFSPQPWLCSPPGVLGSPKVAPGRETGRLPPYPCTSSAHSSALRSPSNTAKGKGIRPLMASAWPSEKNPAISNLLMVLKEAPLLFICTK